jgi:hypothetical protein
MVPCLAVVALVFAVMLSTGISDKSNPLLLPFPLVAMLDSPILLNELGKFGFWFGL